jgi:hypothetical protein
VRLIDSSTSLGPQQGAGVPTTGGGSTEVRGGNTPGTSLSTSGLWPAPGVWPAAGACRIKLLGIRVRGGRRLLTVSVVNRGLACEASKRVGGVAIYLDDIYLDIYLDDIYLDIYLDDIYLDIYLDDIYLDIYLDDIYLALPRCSTYELSGGSILILHRCSMYQIPIYTEQELESVC